jgi:type II secretory pathway component PulJ
MSHRRSTRHRGYFLIELMVIIGIIGVIALVAVELYASMTQHQIRLVAQQEAEQRFDLAVRQLRSDVWNASSATIDEKGELQLVRADGKKVLWLAGNQLNRTCDGQQPEQWNELGAELSLAMHGSTVVLSEAPSPTDPTSGQIAMPMVAAAFKGDTR